MHGDICFHTVKNSLIVSHTCSCSMCVCQKRQDRKGGANPRAQKKLEAAWAGKKGERCDAREASHQLADRTFFSDYEQIGMQLFPKNAWRSALSEASSLPKDLGWLLFSTRVKILLVSKTFGMKKRSKTFSTRECVCANVFGCHHVFGCAR